MQDGLGALVKQHVTRACLAGVGIDSAEAFYAYCVENLNAEDDLTRGDKAPFLPCFTRDNREYSFFGRSVQALVGHSRTLLPLLGDANNTARIHGQIGGGFRVFAARERLEG